MSSQFNIKQNDTSPALIYRLAPPPDLTGATVVFNMRVRGGDIVINRAAAAAYGDPTDGVVSYEWVLADTATAGVYEAEFEVTLADGSIETFPNTTNIIVRVYDDIG